MATNAPTTAPYEEALSKALDLAQPVVDTACGLIESLLGKPCAVAGELLSDQVYAWQCRNRFRIAAQAQKLLKADGTDLRVLPTGFLMPLLEASGNAEEPEIQEMWATLLASAVKAEQHACRLHVETLRRIEPIDAKTLTTISRVGTLDLYAKEARDLDVSSIGRLVAIGLVSWVLPTFKVSKEDARHQTWEGETVEAKPHRELGELVEISPYGTEFLDAVTK